MHSTLLLFDPETWTVIFFPKCNCPFGENSKTKLGFAYLLISKERKQETIKAGSEHCRERRYNTGLSFASVLWNWTCGTQKDREWGVCKSNTLRTSAGGFLGWDRPASWPSLWHNTTTSGFWQMLQRAPNTYKAWIRQKRSVFPGTVHASSLHVRLLSLHRLWRGWQKAGGFSLLY